MVYADLTCFNPELTARFCDLSRELSHGAVVITLSKRLTDFGADHLFLLWEEPAETNWGETVLYVYERKPDEKELQALLKRKPGSVSSNL